MNLRIWQKIFFSMIIISTIVSILIGIISNRYFTDLFTKKSNSEMDHSLTTINTSLSDKLDQLNKHIIKMSYDESVMKIATDIEDNNHEDFANNLEDCQTTLNKIIENNNLVNSTAIIGKNGEFYSTYFVGLNYQDSVNHIVSPDNAHSHSIKWYPMQNRSFTSSYERVIPVAFPFKFSSFGTLTLTTSKKDDILFTLIIMIDVKQLNKLFDQLNKNDLATIVLFNSTNIPLNISQDNILYSSLINEETSSHMDAANPKQVHRFKKVIDNQAFNISATSDSISLYNLRLASIISEEQQLKGIKHISSFIWIVNIIVLILAFFLALMISKTITTPLSNLMNTIHEISKGNYQSTYMYKFGNDEVGELNEAVNNMSIVIQDQIKQIKDDQARIIKAEIDILNHHINPHFIYNTLDSIRWEILNGDTKGSSEMVESLGLFLRLGLNQTNNMLPIEKEVAHCCEYINIMNLRQKSNVVYFVNIAPSAENTIILKLILQPIVENALIHGFTDNALEALSEKPKISIDAKRIENKLYVSVSDNGAGIDCKKAYESLKTQPNKDGHIGLNNVYSRLRAYYGNNVSIEFSSIPFFKNTVTIIIPIKNNK